MEGGGSGDWGGGGRREEGAREALRLVVLSAK